MRTFFVKLFDRIDTLGNKVGWGFKSSDQEDALTAIRESVLNGVILTSALMGLVIYIVSMKQNISEGEWKLTIAITVFYFSFLGLMLFRGLPFVFRAVVTLMVAYCSGLAILLALGPLSSGPGWFFTFAIMAGGLLGVRGAVGALILNLLTYMILDLALILQPEITSQAFQFSASRAMVISANYFLLNTVATVSVVVLVKKMENAVQQEKASLNILKLERERLRAEIETRENAQRALRESEEKYRLLVENQTDLVIKLDMAGRFLFVSPSYCELSEKKEEELLGQPIMSMIFDDINRDLLTGAMERITTHPHSAFLEHKFRTPSGMRWLSWAGKAVLDRQGTILEIIAVGRDITDRKNAEEALMESERLHRSLFDDSPNPLFIQDYSGVKKKIDEYRAAGINDLDRFLRNNPQEVVRLLFAVKLLRVNQAAVDVYQAGDKENLQQTLDRVVPLDKADHFIDQVVTFASGSRRYEGAGKNITFQGQILDVLVRKAVIPGHETDLGLVMAAITDVTDYQRAHRQKEQLASQLRQAQKMEAVGTLAGGIAHDFNNTLQTIGGYAQLIKNKPENWPRNLDHVDRIHEAVQKASDLVKRLLTFSRKLDTDLKPINLNTVVTQTLDLLERTLPRMIKIESRLDPDLKLINGDINQLQQVLVNLASNANDAMPEGGQIVIETRNMIINQDLAIENPEIRPGQAVLLTFTDTGLGLDKQTKKQIFDPFFSTKEIGKGTGLGLSMVYGTVKGHGGHIKCLSRPGEGAAFHLYFPALTESGLAADQQAGPTPEITGGPETILLVDDERAILDVASEILENYGYQIMNAQSGEKAIEIYTENFEKIDLVIMDLGMPGIGGLKCIEVLMEINPEVKVIVASGYGLTEKVDQHIKSRLAGYLPKPYHFTDMLSRIRDILEQD